MAKEILGSIPARNQGFELNVFLVCKDLAGAQCIFLEQVGRVLALVNLRCSAGLA